MSNRLRRLSIREELDEPRQVTDDGWMTKYPGMFDFLVNDAPPRAFSHWEQLTIDLSTWKVYVFFGTPVAFGVFALCVGEWVAGAFFVCAGLGTYVFMLRGTVQDRRNSPVVSGFIDSYTDHPLSHDSVFKETRASEAELNSGERIRVAFDQPEMRELLDQGHRLEVFIEYSPHSQFSTVFAYRIGGHHYPGVECRGNNTVAATATYPAPGPSGRETLRRHVPRRHR